MYRFMCPTHTRRVMEFREYKPADTLNVLVNGEVRCILTEVQYDIPNTLGRAVFVRSLVIVYEAGRLVGVIVEFIQRWDDEVEFLNGERFCQLIGW